MRSKFLAFRAAPSCLYSGYTNVKRWPFSVSRCGRQGSRTRLRAVDRDLDWEPELKAPRTALSRPESSNKYMPPPPSPPLAANDAPFPFRSRREIVLTMLGGSAALWLLNHKVLMPIDSYGDKPPIDFTLAGYTDIKPEEFVYFKTPAGRWMAAAEDEVGRFFMIDEVGDLYYDSGNPDIGLYAMDTQGNLFNFFRDVDGEQKITPVGNVSELKKFKISEIAGVQLDRDVNVVAFKDGTSRPLPPETIYNDPVTGKLRGPSTIVDEIRVPSSAPFTSRSGLFESLFGGSKPEPANNTWPLFDRIELDLNDPRDFNEQLEEQQFLVDPFDPTAPMLPDVDSMVELARQVEEEAKERAR